MYQYIFITITLHSRTIQNKSSCSWQLQQYMYSHNTHLWDSQLRRLCNTAGAHGSLISTADTYYLAVGCLLGSWLLTFILLLNRLFLLAIFCKPQPELCTAFPFDLVGDFQIKKTLLYYTMEDCLLYFPRIVDLWKLTTLHPYWSNHHLIADIQGEKWIYQQPRRGRFLLHAIYPCRG